METIYTGTAVIGTGAAGYHAALRLHRLGQTEIAVFTLGVKNSTSRNTGSDKQTYYKLGLAGDCPDSPAQMARDLFAGRCVDGDHALVEAALSAQCFYHLCEAGVPFPTNRYGEPVGYQTDHDTRGRATSAGPLTSKQMTECLERQVTACGIRVYDRMQVIELFPGEENALGFVALYTGESEKAEDDPAERLCMVVCRNIIWATGGPAGIYADSVYPLGHTGSTGVALAGGARGKNLTEWQYGLASVAPRWNVSGTYMQVLPRFVSIGEDGTEHEFLSEYFDDMGTCLSRIFRKGYEWPFDSRKAVNGSSVIDLLVYRETKLRGRRVYLDFMHNPGMLSSLPFDALDKDAAGYLRAAGAMFGTPLERLNHMNRPAVELYASRGVDLSREMLEIALCAQHNNGGLDVDLWWQTCVEGLFAVGEAAGTHGVYRPGGSALNAGQVGSLRAAQYIAAHRPGCPEPGEAQRLVEKTKTAREELKKMVRHMCAAGEDNTKELLQERRSAMSAGAGAIRNRVAIEQMIARDREILADFPETVHVRGTLSLARAFQLRDTLVTQIAVLQAMLGYLRAGGRSRGSAIYTAPDGQAAKGLEEEAEGLFRYLPDAGELDAMVQIVTYDREQHTASDAFRPVRPIPEGGGFFENVWRSYRENGNIF